MRLKASLIKLISISLFGFIGALYAAEQAQNPTGPSFQDLLKASEQGSNWLYHTRDYAGTRHSPLNQLKSSNIKSLTPSCIHQLGSISDFQTGPLVYDGVMYLTSGSETLALNAKNCRLIWRSDWEYQDTSLSMANRGVAIKDGYVVRGTSDGFLLALDSQNGEVLWRKQIAFPASGEHFTMAPMIYDEIILLGPAGSNNGISGWLGAFSLANGDELWRFYTVPTPEEGFENPLGVKIGGGAIWTPLSLDIEEEALYLAVSNPAPNFSSSLKLGKNLYTNSIVSLNVRSGGLNWFQQLVIADDHGWDLTQVSPLYSTQINRQERKLVATAGKDGMLRVLDRKSHEQVFNKALTHQLNADQPVTLNGTYSCPGVLGGVLWNGSALAVEQELLITPSINLCSTFYRSQETRYVEGRSFFDGTTESDSSTLSGWLTAVDMTTGELKWRYETDIPLIAAVTTTAGGLTLTGEMNGDFIVLDSTDGTELYRFNTGGAIGGGIITYEVDGQQFIAVASGHPSEYQVNGDMGAPTLIVFGMGN